MTLVEEKCNKCGKYLFCANWNSTAPIPMCDCLKGEIKVLPEDTGYCPRCNKCWNTHDCQETKGSGNIYKHLVYNPYMKNIAQVIQEAQDEENLNSGLEWQFVRSQAVTEYEWVAIFERWIY